MGTRVRSDRRDTGLAAGRTNIGVAMASRRVPKHVQDIFQRYQRGFARRLQKPEAMNMFMTEFGLDEAQADEMFHTFDQDKNGVLSLWEFQHFYSIVGGIATDIANKFKELDKDESGKLDPEEARAGLKSVVFDGGRHLTDDEIEFFLRTTVGEDNQLNLGRFAILLHRLKLHEKPEAQEKPEEK